jgi:hypothetical protein
MAEAIEISGFDIATEGVPLADLSYTVPTVGHVDDEPVVVLNTAGGPCVVGGKCTHYGGPLGDGL